MQQLPTRENLNTSEIFHPHHTQNILNQTKNNILLTSQKLFVINGIGIFEKLTILMLPSSEHPFLLS